MAVRILANKALWGLLATQGSSTKPYAHDTFDRTVGRRIFCQVLDQSDAWRFISGLHRDEATPQWVTFGHYTNERLLRTSAGSTKPSCELPHSICISPQGIAQP
jgi:hypothetical protein